MATIDPVVVEGDSRTFIATWNLSNGDTGAPIRYAGAVERTVQIIGTFGGATVSLEGTLELVPTTWLPVTDVQGSVISKTSAALETITELVRHIRPVVTGGSGSAITVLLMMRSTN